MYEIILFIIYIADSLVHVWLYDWYHAREVA